MSEQFIITPSLFFKYSKSPHWIWYDIHGDQSRKADLPELTKKLIEGGVLHEEEYVRDLEKRSIDRNLGEREAEKQTLDCMIEGEELIYQGVITYTEGTVMYKGRPDFLKKIPGRSKFGDYYYIPIEIKYSTKCDNPEYKMQLMLYAIILNKIQDYLPEKTLFINKNKDQIECDLSEKLFIKTNEAIKSILNILEGNEPRLKVSSECKQTPWFDVLMEEAIIKNDISLIYKLQFSILASTILSHLD